MVHVDIHHVKFQEKQMASLKFVGLLAIAGAMFSLNPDCLKAQVLIGNNQSNATSPAQQMLLDMQQNTPAIGGGSMQLLRFTDKNVSFAPLEGLDRLFNWQVTQDDGLMTAQTLGDRVEKFKLKQRQQIISDSQMFAAINRINNK
ncbi:hypothetical protein [Pseudanabaena sp. 'Roaring Creek']|uniref:hypothetical protein n=1 Tax=Pseudanabaena sp. 'Roaring Creek' TaxID=1681830 RepID=UPI0006D82598|nr:hypothetical protein [Pseudanabaena sp. 'Roaring Creek']